MRKKTCPIGELMARRQMSGSRNDRRGHLVSSSPPLHPLLLCIQPSTATKLIHQPETCWPASIQPFHKPSHKNIVSPSRCASFEPRPEALIHRTQSNHTPSEPKKEKPPPPFGSLALPQNQRPGIFSLERRQKRNIFGVLKRYDYAGPKLFLPLGR